MPAQSTAKAAIRLLKARMRQFIYQQKCREDENIWAPMLIVERGFLSGAVMEWEKVLASLDLTSPLVVEELSAVAESALTQARADTIDLLSERIPEVEAILKGLPVSVSDLGVRSKDAN
jgi:hypothetical protein